MPDTLLSLHHHLTFLLKKEFFQISSTFHKTSILFLTPLNSQQMISSSTSEKKSRNYQIRASRAPSAKSTNPLVLLSQYGLRAQTLGAERPGWNPTHLLRNTQKIPYPKFQLIYKMEITVSALNELLKGLKEINF